MNTWLEHISQQMNAAVVRRTRGGVGFQNGKDIQSFFVGHPVHYLDGDWKPITLTFQNGQCDNGFSFNDDGEIFWHDTPLFKSTHVNADGQLFKITGAPRIDGNEIVRRAGLFEYRIEFREGGVREKLIIPDRLGSVIGLETVTQITPQGLHQRPQMGFDANGKVIPVVAGKLTIPEVVVFPIILDPDYSAHTGDASINGNSTVYATARSTSSSLANPANEYISIQNYFYGGDSSYNCNRAFMKYDTSGIPDTDNVTQVNASIYLSDKNVTTDNFDVQIVKYDWSAVDPLTSGNKETAYDNALSSALDDNIWQNTASMSNGTRYSSGNLSTSWINKTGYTYYAMTNSRDRAGNTPTGWENVTIGAQDATNPAQRPYLTITHEAGATTRHFIALKGV